MTNENLYEKKKWQFCPEKRCYHCRNNIEQDCEEEEVITGCPICNSSFVE